MLKLPYWGGVSVRSPGTLLIVKLSLLKSMRDTLRQRIIEVCDKKIDSKGANVGLSFYAFFTNKNDNPALLMEAAEWWIVTHQLDHFEKATKIKQMIEAGL
jgi:Family of unknown function (DUF6500)